MIWKYHLGGALVVALIFFLTMSPAYTQSPCWWDGRIYHCPWDYERMERRRDMWHENEWHERERREQREHWCFEHPRECR